MPENTVNEIIEIIKEKISGHDVTGLPDKFAAEFRITEGGVFYIETLNGKINIAPFEYNDKDILIQTSAENLKKILNKQLSIEKALITRKITISGNLQKAMFIKSLFKSEKK